MPVAYGSQRTRALWRRRSPWCSSRSRPGSPATRARYPVLYQVAGSAHRVGQGPLVTVSAAWLGRACWPRAWHALTGVLPSGAESPRSVRENQDLFSRTYAWLLRCWSGAPGGQHPISRMPLPDMPRPGRPAAGMCPGLPYRPGSWSQLPSWRGAPRCWRLSSRPGVVAVAAGPAVTVPCLLAGRCTATVTACRGHGFAVCWVATFAAWPGYGSRPGG